MAVGFVQWAGKILTSNQSSSTVTFSAGATAGDLLIAAMDVGPLGATVTAPSGFTALPNGFYGGVSGSTGVGDMYWWMKVAAGGETSFTFGQTSASNNWSPCWMLEFSGTPASPTVDTYAWSLQSAAYGNDPQTPAVPVAAGELAVVHYDVQGTNAGTGPNGYTTWNKIMDPSSTVVAQGFGWYWTAADGTHQPFADLESLNAAGSTLGGLFVFKAASGTAYTQGPSNTEALTDSRTQQAGLQRSVARTGVLA